jgi:hypothetical protein
MSWQNVVVIPGLLGQHKKARFPGGDDGFTKGNTAIRLKTDTTFVFKGNAVLSLQSVSD